MICWSLHLQAWLLIFLADFIDILCCKCVKLSTCLAAVLNRKYLLNRCRSTQLSWWNQHQKLITSRGWSVAHAYHVWWTSISAFVSCPAQWQNAEWRTEQTRRALGRAHVLLTKVFSVNKTILNHAMLQWHAADMCVWDFPDIKFCIAALIRYRRKQPGSGIWTIIRIGLKS